MAKKVTTIESRLRGACIAEAKACLSGATKSLRDDDIDSARQNMGRAEQALERAEGYEQTPENPE